MNEHTDKGIEEERLKVEDVLFNEGILYEDKDQCVHVRDVPSAILLTVCDLLTQARTELLDELIGEEEGKRFEMNVDEYVELVEKWNEKNFDVPFDHGYEKSKQDTLTRLREKRNNTEV